MCAPSGEAYRAEPPKNNIDEVDDTSQTKPQAVKKKKAPVRKPVDPDKPRPMPNKKQAFKRYKYNIDAQRPH